MHTDLQDDIDTTQPWHCSYWAGRMGAEVSDVMAAIAEVGPRPIDVMQHLALRAALARVAS